MPYDRYPGPESHPGAKPGARLRLQLFAEIDDQPLGGREQHHQRQQVDDGQDAHHRVGEEEHRGRRRRDRAEEHDAHDDQSQPVDSERLFGHDRQRVFAQVVVVDDGAEREQQDGRRECVLRPFAQVRDQRLLRQRDAVDFGAPARRPRRAGSRRRCSCR